MHILIFQGAMKQINLSEWQPNLLPVKDVQIPQGKQSGWEEPSPPSQRRNIPSIYYTYHTTLNNFATIHIMFSSNLHRYAKL